MIELDKRIIEGKKPLTAFDVMESKFIGTDCYFSDKASDYGDLSNCQLGCLLSADGMTGVFNATKNNSYANFNYCLPAEWVREEELAPKHIDFEAAKKDSNFELCEMYGNELLFDTKNNIFYTSDGNVHTYLTVLAQRHYNEEQPKDVVIEKKYRPFSLEEFLKIFHVGDLIHFRRKNDDEVKCAMFTGYITDVDRIDDKTPGAVELMLGIFHYSLFSLFDEGFEVFFENKWQPFGILEE